VTADTLDPLLAALRDPAVYPHPVDDVRHIETHVSHVLLAGEHAYKLKKPLDLGFLDYATLERRHEMCREELRRNALLAPGLYERVVAITGSCNAPRLRDDPPPDGESALEYAVRMRRFPQDAQLDRMLASGRLEAGDMDRIAACVAGYQESASRVEAESIHGTPEAVWRPVNENFEQCLFRVHGRSDRERLVALHAWAQAQHAGLHTFLEERRRDGFVRACHGDLHLTNLADIDGCVVAFDCIEFDPNLYWIDVVSDTAFLVMDLLARGRRDLAAAFLDAWLLRTGDFDGLRLLRYHLAYRSMVRAKVAAIALSQHTDDERAPYVVKYARHVELAERMAESGGGAVVVLSGLSGSGKSTVTRALVREHAALSVHSDVERKRLFGLAPLEPSGSELDGGIYTTEANRRTYERLEYAVHGIVASGHVAVVDACFLRRSERDRFRELADELGVPCTVLHLDVPHDELLRRVAAREAAGGDPSEAGPEVVRRQITSAEPPAGDEPRTARIAVAPNDPADAVAAAAVAAVARIL
jgi:aminoglycoside phosphotransferase family enzyme/gluconate kinase